TAEAAHPLHAEGEVELVVLLELLLLRLGQEAVAELLRVVAAERRMRERHELAVKPDDGRAVGGEVEVRRLALDHLAQERFHRWHGARYEQAPCHPARLLRRVPKPAQRQLCVTSTPQGNALEHIRTIASGGPCGARALTRAPL